METNKEDVAELIERVRALVIVVASQLKDGNKISPELEKSVERLSTYELIQGLPRQSLTNHAEI